MRILKKDLKKGFVHLKAESPEDLWHLSRVIAPNDHVRGSTERKIKIGGEDARNQKVVRKKMTLTLKVEKASYEHDNLRILGVITDGPDDIARGEHHSINVKEADDISITKTRWLTWEIDILKEAEKNTKENLLVVLFDRESALFARLTNKGQQILSSIKGEVQKKDNEETVVHNFWKAISTQLSEYDTKYKPRSIIAASASFWKEYLKETLSDDVTKKIIYASVSDTGEQALQELVKRPELKTALQQDRTAQEEGVIEDLLQAIAKEHAAYGLDEIEMKINEGNLKSLIISDGFLTKLREEGGYERLETIMKNAESGKATITIITSKDARKQLDGLSGIAGIRRW